MGLLFSKYIFLPPGKEDRTYQLSDGRDYIELKTSQQETIIAYHMDFGYENTVLFSHGNSEELGTVISYFEDTFCQVVRCNAMLYDYTGYGHSTGSPSEACVYADAEAVLDYLLGQKVKAANIVLYGRSLGTAPSVHLASKYAGKHAFRAVILQSPIMSVFRVGGKGFAPVAATIPGDVFCNIDKIDQVRAPLMVIHGGKDSIVPSIHGRELFDRCPSGLDFCLIPDAGHNDLESHHARTFYPRIQAFVHKTAPHWQYNKEHEKGTAADLTKRHLQSPRLSL